MEMNKWAGQARPVAYMGEVKEGLKGVCFV
jgi:hypothetical protein